jgi:PIN domain nuclease of toxin-antitoxin system
MTVIDSSALLAAIWNEPGSESVARHLETGTAVIASVNWAEVVTKLHDRGIPADGIQAALAGLAVEVRPADRALAEAAGHLRPLTRSVGLSLGDRICLALGMELRVPVITADRTWAGLGLAVEVRAIR